MKILNLDDNEDYSKVKAAQKKDTLSWSNVCVSVTERAIFPQFVNGRLTIPSLTKEILHGLSGQLSTGDFLAILGPTGSGKSTLLKAISGRLEDGTIKGTIMLNGSKTTKSWRHMHGYVQQDEVMQEHLTVLETLTYTALLRLPVQLPLCLRMQRVHHLLSQLGLMSCQNTLVGNVSGGERRRTAMAMELISSPKFLFVDEGTTGLDCHTSLQIIEILHKLAVQERKAVLITIHQPRALIMLKIQRIMLLTQGFEVYQGSLTGAVFHFQQQELKQDQISTDVDFLLDNMILDQRTKQSIVSSQAKVDMLVEAWSRQEVSFLDEPPEPQQQVHINSWKNRISFQSQLWLLLKRYLIDYRRYRSALIALAIQTVTLAAMVSLIFFNLGYSQQSVQNRIGLLFFMITQLVFSFTMPLCVVLPVEKQQIKRERWSVSYKMGSLYLAKVLSVVPQAIISTTILGTVVYWCTGLQQSFFHYSVFMTTLYGLVLCSQALAMILGGLVNSIHVSLILCPMVTLCLVVFAGNIINQDRIPKMLIWVPYISPCYYAYQSLMQNEFNGMVLDQCSKPGLCFVTGEQVLAYFSIGKLTIWMSIMMLGVLTVCFHVLGYLILRWKTYPKIKHADVAA